MSSFSNPWGQISLQSTLHKLPLLTALVLEIGTYIGFSTMGWAEAVGPQGHVTGLEFSPEYAEIAKESFTKHGIKNAEVIVGDARES
jgi:predicted O-methyltransferase YrrM